MRKGTRNFLVAAVVVVVLVAGALALSSCPAICRSIPGAVPIDPTTQTINKGEYLARAGDCVACHTAPGGKQFAGGRPMATPFGNLYAPNITPDDETGIGQWTADDFYRMMHKGVSQGRRPDVPGDAFCLLHQGDARGLGRHLRLHDVGAAGEPEESAARVEVSVQPARPADRLANALLQAGRVRAEHEQVGAMEPRRLPGGRPGALRDVPHGDQQARRLEDLAGVRRRHDPQPELVCALAHVEPRGGPWQLEHQGDHRPAAGRRFAPGHRLRADGRGGLQQPPVPVATRTSRRWRSI